MTERERERERERENCKAGFMTMILMGKSLTYEYVFNWRINVRITSRPCDIAQSGKQFMVLKQKSILDHQHIIFYAGA